MADADHDNCEEIIEKLHVQHIQEEEKLHLEHVNEEESLHKAHLKEEALLEAALHHGKVEIHIDCKPVHLKRGKYSVVELKKLGGVSDGYRLFEDKHGHLTPLDDNAIVEIKGGECFESVPQSGGSS
ncbi:MAG: multiubiquitin protein [Cyanobacteriota bacterium erpe_2018_sw_21hr_WHONDRS-SW48-000092_B_bin.40]|jgi:phage-related protein|nr:multiubiquitin protein [Cyanobacteriota bacterium erpe_2018_sw_21hr_WHONDRS-SW48-000092_B_bin.40]